MKKRYEFQCVYATAWNLQTLLNEAGQDGFAIVGTTQDADGDDIVLMQREVWVE